MKITSLDITNIRMVKAFSLELKGNNLHVAGDVAEGKTTVINALWEILKKKDDSISHGARKGIIKIKLSDGSKTIIAERLTTKSASTLRLIDQDGESLGATDFKNMISELSVNPHLIMNLKGEEQVKTLLKAAKVSVDLQAINRAIIEFEDERLDAHRAMDTFKPKGTKPPKAEKISLSDLLAKLGDGEAVNTENNDKRGRLATIEDEHAGVVKKIKTLQKERDELNERIATGIKVCKDLKDIDLAGIREEIGNAEATNDQAVEYNAYMAAEKDYEAKKTEHEDLTEKIKDKREEKKVALDNAEWPLEGLSVEDGKVHYNGCLLENLGESEQMLVCSALAMKDILNHPLRVVRLDGIESMGKEHFKTLVNMFNGAGIQVLSTRVARAEVEPGEIQIVDGIYVEEKAEEKETTE